MRFLLVDKITEVDSEKGASGVKNITLSEDFMAEHFPVKAVMPGVLILESMVQLARWHLLISTNFNKLGLLHEVLNSRFLRPCFPGDTLKLKVRLKNQKDAKWIRLSLADITDGVLIRLVYEGRVICDEKVVATARFSLQATETSILDEPDRLRRLCESITTLGNVGVFNEQ